MLRILVFYAALALGCQNDSNSDSSGGTPTAEIVLGALGDSITQARAAGTGVLNDAPELSWSTGSSLNSSLLQRLQASDVIADTAGVTVIGSNSSVSGAKVANLGAQATALSAADPDIVTIMIGGNDVCASSATSAGLTQSLNEGLVTAVKNLYPEGVAGGPKLVVVASIPNVATLAAIEDDITPAQGVTCQVIWQSACAKLTEPNAGDLPSLLNAANTGLEQGVTALKAENYPIVFDSNVVSQVPIAGNHVAGDCFHPSAAGLRLLADAVWNQLADDMETALEEVSFVTGKR